LGKSEKSLNALLFLLTQDLVMTLDNVILFEQSQIKEVQQEKKNWVYAMQRMWEEKNCKENQLDN